MKPLFMRKSSTFGQLRRGLCAIAVGLMAMPSPGLALDLHRYFVNPPAQVLGRDGRFYQPIYSGPSFPSGGVMVLTPDGRIGVASLFPRRSQFLPSYARTGSLATAVSVGQDGAIYGITAGGGLYGGGVIFRTEPKGAAQTLLSLKPNMYRGGILAAQNGNLYVLGEPRESVLCVSPDGATKTLTPNYLPASLAETATGEIILSAYRNGSAPNEEYALLKLDPETEEFHAWMVPSGVARGMAPQPDGSIYAITDKAASGLSDNFAKIVQVRPDGTEAVVHEFLSIAEGRFPADIFVAKDGSIIGYTAGGGANLSGTIFRCVPGTGEYTVLKDVPLLSHLGPGDFWLRNVLPLLAEATRGNRPPCARTDYLAAETLRGGGKIDVLANDSDADGDGLTIISVGSAQSGSVAFDFVRQRIDYTPAANGPGHDSFSYTIVDGNGGQAVGHVYIRPSAAGTYAGGLSSVADPAYGDPGTPAGSLKVRVNAAGVLGGSIELLGETYRFTGKFGELNVFYTPLVTRFSLHRVIGLQLRLKPAGDGWDVEALAVKNGIPFTGTCRASGPSL